MGLRIWFLKRSQSCDSSLTHVLRTPVLKSHGYKNVHLLDAAAQTYTCTFRTSTDFFLPGRKAEGKDSEQQDTPICGVCLTVFGVLGMGRHARPGCNT